MEHLTTELSQRMARRLRLFVTAVEQVQQRAMRLAQAQYGLTDAQAAALLLVASHPGMRARDVAACLGVSFPSATNMVNRLQSRGLIRRETMGDDKRSVSIWLTSTGLAAVSDLREQREQGIRCLLDATEQVGTDVCVRWIDTLINAAAAAMQDQAEQLCLHCGVDHDTKCPLARITGSGDVPLAAAYRSNQMSETTDTPLSERETEQ